MKRLLLIFSVLLSTFTASAQNIQGAITGTITSADSKPLSNITITLGERSTKTDEDGNFRLNHLNPGNYTLEARGIGFIVTRQNVIIEADKTRTVGLQLNEAETALNEVVVSGANTRSYTRLNTEAGTRTNTPLKDIPQAIQIVAKQILQEQQAYRLSDAFKNVAGITEQGDLNYVNIRGFLTTGANFMINGQRNGYYSLDESPQLPYIDHIEVLKGASSILYGNGAIGGTINLVTKKPQKEFTVDANLTVGSFGLTRFQTNLTGALNKSKTLSALLSVGLENGGSYYRDFKNRSAVVTPMFTWNISDRTELTSITILRTADETSASTGLPVVNGQLFAVPTKFKFHSTDGNFRSKSIQEQLNLKHQFNDNLSGNVWFSLARRSVDANIYGPGDSSPRTDSISRLFQLYNGRLRGYAFNAYLNYKVNAGSVINNIVLGFDYNSFAENYPTGFTYYQDAFDSKLDNIPSVARSPGNIYYQSDTENYGPTRSKAVYVQDQLTISKKLKGLFALRYDDYRYNYYGVFAGSAGSDTSQAHALTPKVGLVYQPLETVSLYGSYSHAFQPQGSNNRAAGGPFPPLRAKQFEFGFKGEFFDHRLMPTITYYNIREVNGLRPDPTDGTGIRQINAGVVTSRGLEATLTGAITTNWNMLLNYARNKITDETGSGFGDTPRDAFSLWTTYQPNEIVNGLKLGLGYRTQSQRVAYGLTLPSYSVLDALIAYKYQKFGISVNGFNLTNKRYALGTFSPGYYFEGAPRSIQASLSYNW